MNHILIAIICLVIGLPIVVFVLDSLGFLSYLYWLLSGGDETYLMWLVKREHEKQ